MSEKIKFASVIFPKYSKKATIVAVNSEYENRDKTATCIKPKSVSDFDQNKIYYVYWSECGRKDCNATKNCCTFYKCQIKSLGG